MGKRTSVYLSDDLEAAVKTSGVPLAELIRRGLSVPPVPPVQVVADDRMPPGLVALQSGTQVAVMRLGDCPHRGLRAGAFCKSCQSVVPEKRRT